MTSRAQRIADTNDEEARIDVTLAKLCGARIEELAFRLSRAEWMWTSADEPPAFGYAPSEQEAARAFFSYRSNQRTIKP